MIWFIFQRSKLSKKVHVSRILDSKYIQHYFEKKNDLNILKKIVWESSKNYIKIFSWLNAFESSIETCYNQ